MPGSPFYDNITLWAAKNGFVGVNLNYRLAPRSPWPAGAEDIVSAIQWVVDNIGARGGDPARIYLMGHSAGATHVATYVAHPEFHKVKNGGLKGAIMVSGFYDLTGAPLADPQRAYFGPDPARYAERSSLDGLKKTKIAFMLSARLISALRWLERGGARVRSWIKPQLGRTAAPRINLRDTLEDSSVGRSCFL